MTEGAQYYELEGPGLGVAFLDEVRRCIRSISNHPESAPVLVGNVRRHLLRRFPYALLYAIKPDGIRILSVMNLRRHPTHWIGRE